MEQAKAKRSKLAHVPTPLAPHAKQTLYCIGTADPAKGVEGGFFFTDKELKKIVDNDDLIGLKVWFEHGDKTKQEIGKVIHAWFDAEFGLMVVLEMFNNKFFANVVSNFIESGLCTGISLGYDAKVQKKDNVTKVVSKTINEVSIVNDPYHKTCHIWKWQYSH